jgi:hypothetical protein
MENKIRSLQHKRSMEKLESGKKIMKAEEKIKM